MNNLNKQKLNNYLITKSKTTSIVYEIKQIHIFLNNNIGKVIDYDNDLLIVLYKNIPEFLKGFFRGNNTRRILIEDVEYFSNNKEDVEAYLNTKKFNI